MSPQSLIFSLALALVLSLLGFMTYAAVLPELTGKWNLTGAQAGWIGGIFFAGYALAVLVLTSLTDRLAAKPIYVISGIVGGTATVFFGLVAEGFWSAMLLRFLAGTALGGMYMPGLRALTAEMPESHKGKAVVYYTSVFALGSGISVGVGGEIAAELGWQWAFYVAGIGFFAAALIAAVVLPKRAAPAWTGDRGHTFDLRPVLRNRQAMGYILSFVGLTWETFAYRVWAVAFVAFLQARDAETTYHISPTVMAMLIAFAGIPASMLLGEAALRMDRRRLIILLSAASIFFAIMVGRSVYLSYEFAIFLALVLGITSYGRNAATTGGMMEAADGRYQGITMASHAFIGFVGGIVGPFAAGLTFDLAGGTGTAAGWSALFHAIALGPILSLIVALMVIRRGER